MEIPVGFITGYTPIAKKEGGMGFIYICKAENKNDELVAIKVLKEDILYNEDIKQRFIKECHLWMVLGKHLNIVEAFNLHLINGQPILILEYLPTTLREKITFTKLSFDIILKYAINICDGMIYVTEKYSDFVHRDLKPENILISGNDTAKITDFGLSHIFTKNNDIRRFNEALLDKYSDDRQVISDPNMIGTPYYMAPEQITGDNPVCTQTDIYAFGCVLFEMLTNRYLFHGIIKTKEYLKHHLTKIPPIVSSLRSGISSNLEAIVGKCLNKDISKRYSNFSELRDILNNELKSLYKKSIDKPVHPEFDIDKLFNTIRGLLRIGAINDAYYLYNDLSTKRLSIKEKTLLKYILGSIKKQENKYDEAIELMEEALQLDAHHDSNVLSMILNDLGNAYQQNGDIVNSINTYEKCIKINPKLAAPHYNIANSYRYLNKFDLAIEYYQKAFNIAADPIYLITLANLYSVDLKDWDKCYKTFHDLMAIYPRESTLYLEYARTLIVEFGYKIKSENALTLKLISQIRLARDYLKKSLQFGCSESKYSSINQSLVEIEKLINQVMHNK